MSDLGNKQIMAENIKYYMDINQIDRNTLCSELKIKYTTLCDWLNAKTYPRIDKIELMANYFHISKADLVEKRHPLDYITSDGLIIETNPPKKSGIYFVDSNGDEQVFDVSSIIYSIIESVSAMPPEQQEMVNNMVGGKKHNKPIVFVPNPYNKKTSPYANAAHARTDIDVPEGTDTSDNDIMDDENF